MAWGALGGASDDPNPINPLDSNSCTGGSSSGSAVAVAAGLVDFALGTDTACSVRLPAACQGLWGMRPSLGALPMDGVTPLSPSLDTVGWMARDLALLEKVGAALLPNKPVSVIDHLLVWPKLLEWMDGDHRTLVQDLPLPVQEINLIEDDPDWLWFRTWGLEIQEAADMHRPWAQSVGLTGNFADQMVDAVGLSDADRAEVLGQFASLRVRIRSAIRPGTALVLPTLTGPVPRLDDKDALDMRRTLCLMSIAGLGGLPQLVMPVPQQERLPLSLSLVGAVDQDRALINLISLVDRFSG